MCKQAAKKIPEVRYIGWDVAFTENGPVIVEGNEYPGYGLLQFYKLKNKKTGHLKEISDILGDEMKNIKL
jgi:D-alanine-D-alanine ligase-like ATP-grasp enzyme